MQRRGLSRRSSPTHARSRYVRTFLPRFFIPVEISPSFASILHRLTGDLEDGLGQALDVAGGDTSDGDTAILGGVDGVL